MKVNEITGEIIDAAMKVHSALGPEVALPIVYDDVRLDVGYRLDLLVSDLVIVEIKAVQEMIPLFEAQLLSYLKLSGRPVGLLINVHVPRLKDGIKRLVNRLENHRRFSELTAEDSEVAEEYRMLFKSCLPCVTGKKHQVVSESCKISLCVLRVLCG